MLMGMPRVLLKGLLQEQQPVVPKPVLAGRATGVPCYLLLQAPCQMRGWRHLFGPAGQERPL